MTPSQRLLTLMGGAVASGGASAVTLPEDKAEALFHSYRGGGVTANGPALLVRKSIADKVSLTGSYDVDSVSNASIDVITTASPFKERRTAYDFALDYVYRDALITVTLGSSREPDYKVTSAGIDIAQEIFGGVTTLNLGFTRSADDVGQKSIGFFDKAHHWQYRFGITQILSPRWQASANFEAVSDDGYLGSPYRVARVFGAAVPERNPRTRSSRAIKLRAMGDLGARDAVNAELRYFWDNWAVKATTIEGGYSRYFGEKWLADAFLRIHTQNKALFYSDNASAETLYVSRNRQLSSFNDVGLGAKLSYRLPRWRDKVDSRLVGSLEFKRFDYKDFTNIRTGMPYSFDATLLQVYLSAVY
jgi:Protein of unknown function (DUF3570)